MSPTSMKSLVASALFIAFASAAGAAVTVTQTGGTLKVKGDAQSNAVAIDGTGALGEVALLINLGPPQPFLGVRDIAIEFGAEGDDLSLRCLQIGGSVRAKMGGGLDEFVVSSSVAALNSPVLIGGSLDVNMGGQSGDFAIFSATATAGITIGGNATIKGAAFIDCRGAGASSDSEATDLFIGGNLRIDSKKMVDLTGDGFTIRLENVNVGGTTKINVGADADSIRVVNGHFARSVNVSLGAGDDKIFLDHTELNAGIAVNGGGGSDTFDTVQLTSPTVPALKSVEIVP